MATTCHVYVLSACVAIVLITDVYVGLKYCMRRVFCYKFTLSRHHISYIIHPTSYICQLRSDVFVLTRFELAVSFNAV